MRHASDSAPLVILCSVKIVLVVLGVDGCIRVGCICGFVVGGSLNKSLMSSMKVCGSIPWWTA